MFNVKEHRLADVQRKAFQLLTPDSALQIDSITLILLLLQLKRPTDDNSREWCTDGGGGGVEEGTRDRISSKRPDAEFPETMSPQNFG